MRKDCKYAERTTVGKEYLKCGLDGSIRKNGCRPCGKFRPTLRRKIRDFFDRIFYGY